MSIHEIKSQYQSCTASDSLSAKNSDSVSISDLFQKEIVEWEKRLKEAIDKEHENDSKGSIQMSEKQWHNLMRKVDSAIDNAKDNLEEQKQEVNSISNSKNEPLDV